MTLNYTKLNEKKNIQCGRLGMQIFKFRSALRHNGTMTITEKYKSSANSWNL